MNNYITGAGIKTLREKKKYTQSKLAQLLQPPRTDALQKKPQITSCPGAKESQ